MTDPHPAPAATDPRPAPRPVLALPGGTDPRLVGALGAALARVVGDEPDPGGPLLVPVEPGADLEATAAQVRGRLTGGVPPEVDVVLRTSGSTTGTGHLVGISGAALRASALATAARLGGHGRWLLCLPAHHVAGVQVLVRSALAGTEPAVLDTAGGFRAADFAAVAGSMAGDGGPGGVPRRYVSLVPTQLVRLLEDAEALAELRGFDAVLVGGAATAPDLLDRARGAGVAVVTTYGMSETGGGCVYDGRPLDGVEVGIGAPGTDDEGRILLRGPVLASAYLDDPAATARAFRGTGPGRALVTSDRGRWDGRRLRVLGRVDDVLVTGGVKVDPAAVEAVVAALPGIDEACVVGVPDPEWGTRVVAVVVPAPVAAGPTDRGAGDRGPGDGQGRLVAIDAAPVRAAVTQRLGRAHAPRHVLATAHLPLRGPGKVDRRAVAALAAAALAEVPAQ